MGTTLSGVVPHGNYYLHYNGFTFDPALTETKRLSSRPVPDKAQRTVKYVETVGVIQTMVILPPSGGQTVDARMDDIKQRLTSAGGALYYRDKGFGDFNVNVPGGVKKDAAWGPWCDGFDAIPIGDAYAWQITWSFRVCIPWCNAAKFENLLSEWVYKVDYNYDAGGYLTSRVVSGSIEIPMTRASQNDRFIRSSADDYRHLIVPEVPRFFTKGPSSFSLSEDRRSLTFNFTQHQMEGDIPPPGVLECSMSQSMSNDDPMNFCRWTWTLQASYEMVRGVPGQVAADHFIESWSAKRKEIEAKIKGRDGVDAGSKENNGAGAVPGVASSTPARVVGAGLQILSGAVGGPGAALAANLLNQGLNGGPSPAQQNAAAGAAAGGAVLGVPGAVAGAFLGYVGTKIKQATIGDGPTFSPGGAVAGGLAGAAVGVRVGGGAGAIIGAGAGALFGGLLQGRRNKQPDTTAGQGDQVGIFPVYFRAEEPDRFKRTKASFTLVSSILGTREAFLMDGLWTPFTNEKGDPTTRWNEWYKKASEVFGPYGTSGIKFNPRDDIIIDVCRNDEPDEHTLAGRKPVQVNLKGLNAAMTFTIDSKNSWMDWHNSVQYLQDDAVVPNKPLLEDRALAGLAGAIARPGGLIGVDPAQFLPANDRGAGGFAPATGEVTSPFSTIARRVASTYTVLMTGYAIRAAFPPNPPSLTSIGGQPVASAMDSSKGDGFKCDVIANFGTPIYGSAWQLRYICPASPSVL